MEAGDIVSRVTAMVLLLVGTLGFGTLPIYIVRKLQQRRGLQVSGGSAGLAGNLVTSFLMCFGGGVLFATCFIHLLPDVRENFQSAKVKTNGTSGETGEAEEHEFPLPEFLVCAGFLAVYFIEEVLHAALGHAHGHHQNGSEIHGHSHSPAVLACFNRETEAQPPVPARRKSLPTIPQQVTTVTTVLTGTKTDPTYGSTDQAAGAEIVLNPNYPLPNQQNGNKPSVSNHQHSHGLGADTVKLSFGGLLIVVALSFHSIFEGLAIGLQKTARDVWTTFIAVAIHKFVISFVVGLEVYADGTRVKVVIIYMVIFAVMSPLGIFIGMVSQMALSGTTDIAIGYLNALATGTLLYVTFFEVLQREKNSQLAGLYQFLAVVVGFALMVVLNVFFAD